MQEKLVKLRCLKCYHFDIPSQVEKSLQRMHNNQRSTMYVTEESIERRVDGVGGWKDLLTAMGFRFEAPSNGSSASVFFPTSDPGDRLAQCSASLQAMLGRDLVYSGCYILI